MTIDRHVLSLAIALALVACGPPGAEPVIACDPVGGARPVCGFLNPEDLAVLPGGESLLVSQFGSMDGAKPGNLAVFDLADEKLGLVFRGGDATGAPSPGWGDADCPGPPGATFAPHGIDLAQRPDGRTRLLVVNHGREAIEFFEIDASARPAVVAWRGCATPPDGTYMNDVASLPDGGFVATHMFPKTGGLAQVYHGVRGLLGMDTGYVIEWQPGAGFHVVAGTDAPFPNGIETSPDGRDIFLNVYMGGGEVRRIARASGELKGTVEIAHPDNVTWGEEGQLLVASHADGLEIQSCATLERGACPARYAIVAVDPETLASRVVYENAGAPMGGGTVAVEVAGELFIGSFAGDRLVRVRPDSVSAR